MSTTQVVIAFNTVCLTLCCAGCAPTHQDYMTFLKSREHVSSGSTYRLAPPDVVRIHAPQAPEVDTTETIRADGTVHLRLLGEVRLAGLTPREAASKLQQELRSYYRDPTVDVSLVQAKSKVIYMFGEVGGGVSGDKGARVRLVNGRDTLLHLLTEAQLGRNAWLSQIKVIRPGATPEDNQEMIINFERMMASGDLSQDIILQEGDVVYIPPTPGAWIGYRIAQILQPVSPVLAAYRTPNDIEETADLYSNNDN